MSRNLKIKITAATPIFCVIVFLILGFADDFGFSNKPLWHPGWTVFLLMFIIPVILGTKKLRFSWPFICVIIYLILGFALNLWHPGWIIFLTIPLVGIFSSKSKDF